MQESGDARKRPRRGVPYFHKYLHKKEERDEGDRHTRRASASGGRLLVVPRQQSAACVPVWIQSSIIVMLDPRAFSCTWQEESLAVVQRHESTERLCASLTTPPSTFTARTSLIFLGFDLNCLETSRETASTCLSSNLVSGFGAVMFLPTHFCFAFHQCLGRCGVRMIRQSVCVCRIVVDLRSSKATQATPSSCKSPLDSSSWYDQTVSRVPESACKSSLQQT